MFKRINKTDIIESVREVEKDLNVFDVHDRVFSLVDMRVFVNRVIDELKKKEVNYVN